MSRGSYLRSMRGVLIAALATGLMLALPVVGTWGAKDGHHGRPEDRLLNLMHKRFLQVPRLASQPRPADLSPFGPNFALSSSQSSWAMSMSSGQSRGGCGPRLTNTEGFPAGMISSDNA